ncbi:hypothetical protein roselon_00286 [Roseibacterium elongatum DSM 19469]|uniref:Uncharacterized protein n=1 Tax=Roseicyclus elongatus DSM 19469 TaxID=1294273 RepID=W8S1X6_9RHOB|nr:hypothetical protein [Roseibacterium elongatum]AHM02741.1 hypothetical protein roselon_00286 [Roseibacterium elongatum DSM 19469]
MDVILHLGAHRTAETGLAAMATHHAAALSQAGLVFWARDEARAGLFDGPVGAHRARRAGGRLAMRAAGLEAGGARTLVVSDARMLGPLRHCVSRLRPYPDAGARVARIAGGLGAHRLTLALAIRCYDAWWASVLARRESLHADRPAGDLGDRLVTQPMRWRHVIADLARSVPQARVVVWTHEAMAARPDLVLGRLGGVDPALFSRAMRPLCGGDGPAAPQHEGRMPFDAHHRAALRAQYAEDLAWLSAGGGGLADYMDEPAEQMRAVTAEGRGHANDPEPECTRPRRVARARRKGTERARPR